MPSLVKWYGNKAKDIVRDPVMAMLESMGQAVRDKAVELAPIDTGHLKASIGYTIRQSDMTVQIHADAKYAYFVEFGSRRMKAQPFLRPALLAARNWSNRSVNTEMQFGAIQSSGKLPMPRANSHAIRQNEKINGGLNKKFKGLGSILHKRPKIVFHGNTARSQTGRSTHPIHERFADR